MQNSSKRTDSVRRHSLADWLSRDIAEPDWLMGTCLSTTDRWLVVARTGLGKTNFALALGMRIAEGKDFLHWKGQRKARVLYIDGEMSNRLLKRRLASEVKRMEQVPETFSAVCVADLDDFQPLNTEDGQARLWSLIDEIGGVDVVIFDSVMCLLSGNMIDEAPWSQVMPLVHSLTKKSIGQIWVHHTGHKEGQSYGTKTREWQMDAVIIFEPIKRNDTDVSFTVEFRKARKREPENRADFQNVKVALVGDEWTHEHTDRIAGPKPPSPKAMKCLDALRCVIDRGQISMVSNGKAAASVADWKAECYGRNLFNRDNPKSANSEFHKCKRVLLEAGLIMEGQGGLFWLPHPQDF